MTINQALCWIKGFGDGPGGRSWWGIKNHLIHPSWNTGAHEDEKVNIGYDEEADITYYDFRCKRCRRISTNWQDVTEKNARIVMAELQQAVDKGSK